MMRCRPGTVTHTAFATVPDQRRTASLSLALHRIRDTSDLILAPMGSSPRITIFGVRAFYGYNSNIIFDYVTDL